MIQSDLEALAEPFKQKAYRLVELIARDGLPFRVFETRRSFSRSASLFMQGRAYKEGVLVKVGPTVTNARAGSSPHNWGLALDAVLVTDPLHSWWHGHEDELPKNPWDLGDAKRPVIKLAWERYGRAVRAADLAWGGDWAFKDWGHAELRQWASLRPKDWVAVTEREVTAGR